ncbi:MAG: uracil-DNA glycosylase [Candidatus Latescibacteria bacterium]|nr:uracil-DNA glycosylase [Candidatus Latescibacterota bacterium]NIM22575.1 uracil-DNA glycosylase [Candidatus Latescibacterota bacterium]NIM64864.1 uracil-DNA glycosylase [Candidatus Latescibacterota bacterium]NIO01379.1 uracil-DNA glycosylase [Candidatus Latescibacterota bacterium]NIO27889.1 uracil-DNA glycosylase [Candidatus Latescibacterota bacterium]
MKKELPSSFPQEILPDLISYLKHLEGKGIRSLYLDDIEESGPFEQPSSTSAEGGEPVPVTAIRKDLAELEEGVRACTDCPLHETRTQVVFGVGNPGTKVMFIGEAPGRDEDLQGEPFVGRAGQLLTKILEAIDQKRENVYITNILKCRPPDNRDPQESEVRCCEKYLISQIELIQPKLICALGRIAAQWLLQTKAPLGTLRTGEYYYQGIRVLVTYHPAALLRNPQFKRPAWEDFKKLKAMLEASP